MSRGMALLRNPAGAFGVALLCVSGCLGCQAEDSPAGGASAKNLPAFCSREGANAVRDVFCKGESAGIRNLGDLQERLELGFLSPGGGARAGYGGTINTRLVFLGHSTALSGQLISPINPRAIVLGPKAVMAFNRGVQQVELASSDRKGGALDFYLVTFEQACNTSSAGCTPGDLYTPRIESDWVNVRIQDDEDLKNTPSDCRQCHQRGRETPLLLMRELEGPWTHFFMADGMGDVSQADGVPEPTGADLTRDYVRAKGDEPYGGIPAALIRSTAGFSLEVSVGLPQPLLFDGIRISNERWPYGENGYASEPVRSPMWDGAYAAFKRGEQMALPHFEPRPTDPTKQAKLTAAYQRYLSGEISAEELPDLSDIFPDDAQVRAEIGLQTEPLATPAEALVQACGSCHNDVLDQNISRARFSIDLARMDRAELDVAMARINAPPGAPGRMPPPESRQLDANGREQLIDYLRQNGRSIEDDALLGRVAQLGMAGGG